MLGVCGGGCIDATTTNVFCSPLRSTGDTSRRTYGNVLLQRLDVGAQEVVVDAVDDVREVHAVGLQMVS